MLALSEAILRLVELGAEGETEGIDRAPNPEVR
jgi:hypothetical protein